MGGCGYGNGGDGIGGCAGSLGFGGAFPGGQGGFLGGARGDGGGCGGGEGGSSSTLSPYRENVLELCRAASIENQVLRNHILFDQKETGRVAQRHRNGLDEGHGAHVVAVQKSRGLHQMAREETKLANFDAAQLLNSTTV